MKLASVLVAATLSIVSSIFLAPPPTAGAVEPATEPTAVAAKCGYWATGGIFGTSYYTNCTDFCHWITYTIDELPRPGYVPAHTTKNLGISWRVSDVRYVEPC